MKQTERIISKIVKIENLLSELKQELINYKIIETKSLNKNEKPILTTDSLKTDFDNLYLDFVNKGSTIVDEFVNNKEHFYLKQFCRANNITLDPKQMSKDKIVNEIIRWFIQRKAISKRI